MNPPDGLLRLAAASPELAQARGRWLCANLDLRPCLPGADASVWWRTASGGRTASATPPEGPWDGIALRCPRGREEEAMLIDLCAARLAPGGLLWAVAPSDEGGKGIARRLAQRFTDVGEERFGGHARAAAARAPRPGGGALAEHAVEVVLPLPSGPERFVSFPGLFAHGRLDAGTALLLEVLPDVTGLRVLDLGCGAGVLGRACATAASLDLVDVDALAVHAAGLNVPGARVTLADGVPAGGPWDLVVSNPPLHTGSAVDPGLWTTFAAGLRRRLSAVGAIVLVTHGTVPVGQLFSAVAPVARKLAERRPYVVWRLEQA